MKRIKPFWDDEYKKLNYRKEIFNDEYAIQGWREQGYQNPIESFSGEMANHGDVQPKWNDGIVKWATEVQELQDLQSQITQLTLSFGQLTLSRIKLEEQDAFLKSQLNILEEK